MNTQLKSANNVVALVHSNLSEAFGDNITKPFKDKEDSGEFNSGLHLGRPEIYQFNHLRDGLYFDDVFLRIIFLEIPTPQQCPKI